MAQRKIYNTSDAAKSWRKSTLQDSPIEDDEYPDLLLDERDGLGDRVATKLNHFDDDDADEFEDLLSGNDELLWERIFVERETEEMLFGSGWEEEPRDEDEGDLLDRETGGSVMVLL